MDPVIQTPTAEPVAPPPAAPIEAPPAAPVKSELQTYREQKKAALNAEPVLEPAAPAAPVAPEIPAEHLVTDDDGERYDARTREGKRVKKLLGITKAQEARIAELAALVGRTQAPPPAAPAPKPTQPAAAVSDPNDPEPTLEQFADKADPYAAYVAALSRWNARLEHQTLEQKRAAADRASKQTADREAAQKRWDDKMPDVTQRYPDFPETWDAFYDSLAPFAQPIVVNGESKPGRHRYLINRLLQSEHGHDVAYFLGKHPAELEALFSVKGFDQHVLAIGRIEERVLAGLKKPETPKPSPVTPPPAPMAPVGAAATTSTTYDARTANLQQFRAHKKRQGVA